MATELTPALPRPPSVENTINSAPIVNVQNDTSDQYVISVRRLQTRANIIISLLVVIAGLATIYIIVELSGGAALGLTGGLEFIRNIAFAITAVATSGLGYYGLYFTHRFGGTARQIAILERAGAVLAAGNQEFENQTERLAQEVTGLNNLTRNTIRNTQNKLEDIVKNGEEIGRIGNAIQTNNEDTIDFFNAIKIIQQLTKQLQRQIGKNELVKIFYELENADDGKPGLNKQEYDVFILRLDKETADAWREVTRGFRRLAGRDDIISYGEFERGLNRVYDFLDRKDQRDVEEINRQLIASTEDTEV